MKKAEPNDTSETALQLLLCHNPLGHSLRAASQAAWQSNIFWQNSEISSVVSLPRNDMATKCPGPASRRRSRLCPSGGIRAPRSPHPIPQYQTSYPYPFINNKKADKTCNTLHGKFCLKNTKEGKT